MNQKHEAMMTKLHARQVDGKTVYWRKRWHTRKPAGWTILGVKMKPVSLSKAKKRVGNEIQNNRRN
jgi:hypothetical protein